MSPWRLLSYSEICWNHCHLTWWCILDNYKSSYWCQIRIGSSKQRRLFMCLRLFAEHSVKPQIDKAFTALGMCLPVCMTSNPQIPQDSKQPSSVSVLSLWTVLSDPQTLSFWLGINRTSIYNTKSEYICQSIIISFGISGLGLLSKFK